MIVRCVRQVSIVGVLQSPTDSWLTVGRDYTVLELAMDPTRSEGFRSVEVRVEAGHDATPGLFSGTNFVVVDGRLPSNWRATISENGRLDLGPESWQQRGFWEDYFDREPQAIATYESERLVIAQANLSPGL
jgi:hypothetical protein